MDAQYLYIIFSSTPNRMGRFIRFVTGSVYNHISIAFDENLSTMYSFARRYYRTPLYGGFVTEHPSRYHIRKKTAEIMVCKLPISPEDYASLSNRIADMEHNREHFIYNHFSAIAASFHRSYPITDAYICSEFCISLLKDIGFSLPDKNYLSICEIRQCLQPYCVYSGPIPPCNSTDVQYFSKHPVPRPFLSTLRLFCKLVKRVWV